MGEIRSVVKPCETKVTGSSKRDRQFHQFGNVSFSANPPIARQTAKIIPHFQRFKTEGISMKKILASAALLTMLSASAVMARPATTTDIKLDGFCNIYSVTVDRVMAKAQDTPSCTGTYGGGLVGTTKGFGKSVILALQDQGGSPGVQMVLQLSYPFTPTGTFTIYQTTDGQTFQDMYDGTYEVDSAPGKQHGHERSITSVFQH
jgi:hypothetical protein